MNLNEFISKYEGKNVNEDWTQYLKTSVHEWKTYWGYQCVALIKVYVKEVLWEINTRGHANAYIWNLNKEKFNIYYPNSGEIPKAWDILSWGSWVFWHIVIVLSSDEKGFTFFEQNGASEKSMWFGWWNDIIRKNYREYKGTKIIAWARHKSLENNTPIIDNISNNPKPSSPQIQPNFNIWNEERPYDNVTKEEMDDMIVKAFGLNVDYYTIFNKYWKDLIRDPNATRVDYCTRAGRGNNTLTFENFGYKFDRMTIAKFIINIQTLWTGVELPIATESEVREIFFKYFPNQNPSDVFRRYFPEIQETNNFLFDIRRAWYQSNKIKNEFKHDRFYILSCILDMKKKLG